MESYHFFQIEIENSYFVPFRRPSTKKRTRKALVGSYGFAEPIESAPERSGEQGKSRPYEQT
eukprot:scaffold4850_cov50-Attheya_sp.AAC.1